jgi:hypothetical protein
VGLNMKIVLFLTAFFTSLAAYADSISDNEQAVSQAQNSYFSAMMQNPSMSNKDKGQLYYQMVQPTENTLTKSIANAWSETIQSRLAVSAAQDPGNSPASKLLTKAMSKKSGKLSDENSTEDLGVPSNSSVSQGNTTPAAHKDETALSASGIKPILEFPGRRPKPSPSPTLN